MDKRLLPELGLLLIFGVFGSLSIFPRFLPCDDEKNGTVVRCHGRYLTHVPQITSDTVIELDLSRNKLRQLTTRTFAGVPNLENLNLSNNCQPRNLRPDKKPCKLAIQHHALKNLKHLKVLDLSGNSLTEVPSLPKHITFLNLNLNHIYKLSETDFAGLIKLTSLKIGWNCYYRNACNKEFTLEGELKNITSLEILDLSINNMTSFPKNLPSALLELYLAENKIWKIDKDDLCPLGQLQKLDVQWNCQRCDHAAQPCFPCQNNSALQLGPGVFDCLTNLTYLNLRGNSLRTIDSSLFDKLSNLAHLVLSDNLLNFAKETLFSKLTKVHTLDLDFNFHPIYMYERLVINPTVAAMKSLEKVSLNGNFFNILDANSIESLLRLPKLKEISLRTNFILQANLSSILVNKNILKVDLSGNLISFQRSCENRTDEFPASFFSQYEENVSGWVELQPDINLQRKHVKESTECQHYNRSVDLSFNNLMALHPDNFVGMEDIECLNISYNYINQRLNGTQFGHLSSLRHLDLSHNRFDLYYYRALSELSNLTILNLAYNEYQFRLKGVNHRLNFLENLTNLIELDLSHNMIGLRITKELRNPSLERLFFRHNELVSLWEYGKQTYITLFSNFTRLKLLDISHNKLVAIPVQVLENFPTSLETLIISHNNLKVFHWKTIAHLVNLTQLNLSHNFLKSLYSNVITNTSKLTQLNLQSNKITSVSKEFFELHRELRWLSLAKNLIQTIDTNSFPKQLLQTLQYLDVQENPFDCTCHTSWFIQFLMETKIEVCSLSTNMICDSPDSMRGKQLLSTNTQSCQDLYGHTSFVFSSIVVTTFLAITLTWKFFSWDLWYFSQVLMASIKRYSKLPGQSSEEYDAFIVFNTKDGAITDWVYHELLVQLEGPEMGQFNLCLEERDWLAGKSSIENLYDSIYNSKRTVFILDHKGFSSGLLCHAFLMSHQRLLDEKKDVVVLVILDHRMKMSQYLLTRKRICPKTFLIWPRNPRAHGHFWHRLHALLRQDRQRYYDPRLQKQLAQ